MLPFHSESFFFCASLVAMAYIVSEIETFIDSHKDSVFFLGAIIANFCCY